MKPRAADVAVVGAGAGGHRSRHRSRPGGALRRRGRQDPFPPRQVLRRRPDPRGRSGCWSTSGWIRRRSPRGMHPKRLVIRSPSGRQVAYPLPAQGQYAATAERRHLDAALVDLARHAGAEVLDGRACDDVTVEEDRVVLGCGDAGPLHARYAVAADGMWSPVRRMLGLSLPSYRGDWHAFRQYYTGRGAGGRRGTARLVRARDPARLRLVVPPARRAGQRGLRRLPVHAPHREPGPAVERVAPAPAHRGGAGARGSSPPTDPGPGRSPRGWATCPWRRRRVLFVRRRRRRGRPP